MIQNKKMKFYHAASNNYSRFNFDVVDNFAFFDLCLYGLIIFKIVTFLLEKEKRN